MNEQKYRPLIEKIKRRRKWVIAASLIFAIIIINLASPITLVILDETIIETEGLHPAITVVLVLFCIVTELFAYAIVSMPLTSSMDQECDPEKHLVLNLRLNKQKNIDYLLVVDHLYLGHYGEAIFLANKMIASKGEQYVLVGLFNKARAEFLLGESEAFYQTVDEYKNKLQNCNKLNSKTKEVYQKIDCILDLMSAILKEDIEQIEALRNTVQSWKVSRAIEGFVDYIKGISAYKVSDTQEAIYRFKRVKEYCSKTVFAGLSDDYLQTLI